MRIGVTVGWFYAALRGMAIIALAGLAGPVAANNIGVTNVGLTMWDSGARTANVVFDLAWNNSWRDGEHRDAAWVFVKFRAPGSNNWEHAKLSTANHTAPSGGTIDVGSDGTNGMGVFIYSSANHTGSVNYAKTKLRWQYGSNGYNFAQGAMVEVSVHAIEMVYIPEGAFYLGSGGSEAGHFYCYPTVTDPYMVSSETNAITVGGSSGNLYYTTPSGDIGDGTGIISNAFPKGYGAFYCMKYEISQGQYADFLNKLTATQDGARFPNQYGNYRHTIGGTTTNRVAGRPDRACNFLVWSDGSAYADWAALRPMTELEFEKACRGPATPVTNEYAWGTNTIMDSSKTLRGAEDGTETVSNSAALGGCNYGMADHIGGDGGKGPLRVGIFATNNATRISSGAGYYGVMELSGNVWERPVTVGNPNGRKFMGTHGDGFLDVNGNATGNTDWPGTDASGAGCRGGHWSPAGECNGSYMRVSDRNNAATVSGVRVYHGGWRAVRSAP